MPALQIPTIESERIRLEPLSTAHSSGMFDLWREPAVCEYSGPSVDSAGDSIELPAESRTESDRLLRFWLDRAQVGTGFRWAAVRREDSAFLGAVGFNALGPSAEYAYHLVPKFWGSGFGSESSRLALSWAFSQGSDLIELFIERANAKSILLAERLGFERPTPPSSDPDRYVLTRARHSE